MLRSVRTVIVDEIHAVIGTRRGAHLAITLERLQRVASAPLHRVGLSATQNPIDEVAKYLVGTGPSSGPAGHLLPMGEGQSPDCPSPIVRGWREAPGEGIAIIEGHRRAMDLALEMPRSPLET